MLKSIGYVIPKDSKLSKLFEQDKHVKIKYSDFCTSIINVKEEVTDEDLYQGILFSINYSDALHIDFIAFRILDTENSGRITVNDIKNYIHRKGESWSDDKASLLINEVDGRRKLMSSLKEEKKRPDTLEIDEERFSMSFNTFKDFIVRESGTQHTMSDTNSELSKPYTTVIKNDSTYKENYFG
jgi:hypothetical protein